MVAGEGWSEDRSRMVVVRACGVATDVRRAEGMVVGWPGLDLIRVGAGGGLESRWMRAGRKRGMGRGL